LPGLAAQGPVQLTKVFPGSGVAVRTMRPPYPYGYRLTHWNPHVTAGEALFAWGIDTDPDPVPPVASTLSATGVCVKLARPPWTDPCAGSKKVVHTPVCWACAPSAQLKPVHVLPEVLSLALLSAWP